VVDGLGRGVVVVVVVVIAVVVVVVVGLGLGVVVVVSGVDEGVGSGVRMSLIKSVGVVEFINS